MIQKCIFLWFLPKRSKGLLHRNVMCNAIISKSFPERQKIFLLTFSVWQLKRYIHFWFRMTSGLVHRLNNCIQIHCCDCIYISIPSFVCTIPTIVVKSSSNWREIIYKMLWKKYKNRVIINKAREGVVFNFFVLIFFIFLILYHFLPCCDTPFLLRPRLCR